MLRASTETHPSTWMPGASFLRLPPLSSFLRCELRCLRRLLRPPLQQKDRQIVDEPRRPGVRFARFGPLDTDFCRFLAGMAIDDEFESALFERTPGRILCLGDAVAVHDQHLPRREGGLNGCKGGIF